MLFPNCRKFIKDNQLIQVGDSVILAVSGGCDSMVMLDLCARLATQIGFTLSVAHVNHMLRGRASDADEKLVRDECDRMGIACSVFRKRPRPGTNLQDSARRSRYSFLEKLARKNGATSVATAHHRLDQVETILSHLLRGSGIAGLRGMAPVAPFGDIKIIRPLIFASREEIDDYARTRRVSFNDDATNATTKYSRNAIRHKLIPILEELSPRAIDNIALMGDRLSHDDDALLSISQEIFADLCIDCLKEGVRLDRSMYSELPRALRIRSLRQAYAKLSGTRADLNSDQLGKMDDISLGKRTRASYRLKSPFKFIREGNLISIVRSESKCDRA